MLFNPTTRMQRALVLHTIDLFLSNILRNIIFKIKMLQELNDILLDTLVLKTLPSLCLMYPCRSSYRNNDTKSSRDGMVLTILFIISGVVRFGNQPMIPMLDDWKISTFMKGGTGSCELLSYKAHCLNAQGLSLQRYLKEFCF